MVRKIKSHTVHSGKKPVITVIRDNRLETLSIRDVT